MNRPQIEKKLRKPRILVAPLDWGLGHATRCIPVIRELLAQDANVWLAGESAVQKLLTTEFPDLPFLELRGYRAHYAASATGLKWQMLLQSGKFFSIIRKENAWLEKACKLHHFDGIISDNRFGLYHKEIPCVFITHQLRIKSYLGRWSEKIIQKFNYRYVNRFSECWVPDVAGDENLAGELSHPSELPAIPLKYLGTLSRFNNLNAIFEKNHILFLLSGPEPQRTILENKIITQVAHYEGNITIARGLPGHQNLIPSTNTIHVYNHLTAGELNKEIVKAEYVIGRSGYSTIMDMATLQKKCIYIPTPGQTEQVYLANLLQQKKIAYSISQKRFSLPAALEEASKFSYQLPKPSPNLLKETISNFLTSLTLN